MSDYKFNIGDEVVYSDGDRGRITYICECNRCKERGFCEHVWLSEIDNEEHYITSFTAEKGFKGYYRIGQYRFDGFWACTLEKMIQEHEEELARLRKKLAIMKEESERRGGEE